MKIDLEVIFKPKVPVDGCGIDGDTLDVSAEGLDALAGFNEHAIT